MCIRDSQDHTPTRRVPTRHHRVEVSDRFAAGLGAVEVAADDLVAAGGFMVVQGGEGGVDGP